MGINLNVLSAISGAAEQYTKQTSELKKELRENKRRQRDWLATYGSKALNENKQQQESVQSALDDLKARGLDTPDAIQLLQKHGVGSVLELSKYVKEYEVANNTKVDKDLMDKLWTAADDFTTTETTFEAAVAKVFGTSAGAATAPVIQEAEDRNFFEQLKYNLGERYDDELEDFLTDASEGIGGKSIRELRAMSASSPSMLGTEGSAVFDRSALRGSESTSAERAAWKELKGTILSNALNSLDPTVANKIRVMQGEINDISRNDDDQWNILTATNAPEAYKEAIAEATRNAAQGIDLGSNRAAWNSYGGQDALDAILNPPPPPEPLTPEEKAEQLEQDLIDNNLTGENRPEDLGESTNVQVGEYFRDNNKDFVISNGELVGRPEDAPFDESKVVELPPTELPVEEGTYNSDLTLKAQPTVAPEGIPKRPEPIYRGEEKKLLEKPRNKRAIDDWDDQYGDKYNYDGTYKIVRPQGPRPEDINSREYYEYELWEATYGDTHDPRTGYPLIEGLDKTLIPNSEVTE